MLSIVAKLLSLLAHCIELWTSTSEALVKIRVMAIQRFIL